MPFFDWDEELGQYVAMHHPFTAPMDECIPYLESDQGSVRAKAYDLVLNGIELSSGSIRITDPALQKRMFRLLGLSEEEAQAKFGYPDRRFPVWRAAARRHGHRAGSLGHADARLRLSARRGGLPQGAEYQRTDDRLPLSGRSRATRRAGDSSGRFQRSVVINGMDLSVKTSALDSVRRFLSNVKRRRFFRKV